MADVKTAMAITCGSYKLQFWMGRKPKLDCKPPFYQENVTKLYKIKHYEICS